MRTVEVYIVKGTEFTKYDIRNTMGIGLSKLEKPEYLETENQPDIINKFIVKVNGEELENLNDYFVQENKIIFNNPLSEGDKIEVYDSILNNVKIVTKNTYNKNALFKIFGSGVKFKLNHTYDFSLPIKSKIFSTQFSTKYDPFLTTVNKIRLDTGDLLNNATDNQIANIIYQNSKDVIGILGDDADEIPVYATNVARYRTDIDLCWAIYLSASGKYGVNSKKIGTIEIEKNIKVPYIETMVKRFKELLTTNEELLKGSGGKVLTFVKANSTDYTVPNRGVF